MDLKVDYPNVNIFDDMTINSDLYMSLSDEEKQAVQETLKELSQGVTTAYDQLYYIDYAEIPVDFYTFITDDRYLGKSTKHGTLIYDFWKTECQKIFNLDNIVEVALSGAIGLGKTTIGCAMMAYHMYRTMCMKNPQEFFGLRPGSKITYAFLNNTLGSSYGVGYDTFQSFLMESPWFLKHGTIVGRGDTTRYVPGQGFEVVVGSRVQHTLGRNVIAALLDEVSFAPGQDVNYLRSKIMELYRNIRRRMDSRFTVDGKNYGKLFLISSKSTESSFLEAYIADQVKKGYPIYVVDQPIWVVKPFMFKGGTFKVAVGNKFIPSRILKGSPEEIEAAAEALTEQGMRVIDVPIETKQAFDQDIDKALQDIAGIATSVVTKKFSMEKIQKCVSEVYENPFRTDIVTLGLNDKYSLKDFFEPSKIPDFILGAPTFIHLDASVSGDRTGLSGVAIIGTRQVVDNFHEDEDGNKLVTDELVCQQVFSIGIQAPADSEISFEKTRQFIYYLKDEVGLNIKKVTTDGFQSVDTRQILSTKGYEVGYTSLDRSPDGYDGFRSAVLDRRVILLKGCYKLWDELTDLECDNMNRKYDHPIGGSKDISDSLAGAHLDAMQYKEEFMFFHPGDYDYEGLNDNTSDEEKFLNDMRSSILGQAVKPSKVDDAKLDQQDPLEVNNCLTPKKLDAGDIFDSIYGSIGPGHDDDILFI